MDTKRFRFLAAAVLCSLMLLGALSAASADVSPPGCTTNGLNMSISRSPFMDHNGDVVQYVVTVTNPTGGGDCDVTDVTVTFTAPAADGTPTGTTTTLGTGLSFPVGTSMTWNSTGSGGAIANPALAVTLALNPSVTVATAKADFAGILHDAPGNDAVSGEKTVSVTILHPCITATKTASPTVSKAGDVVTYHICVTNCSDDDDTLNNLSVTDPLLGDLSGMFPASLPVGQTACADVPYTVKQGDPDPLVNTVTVSAADSGASPETVTFSTTATVDLIHPNIAITKVASPTTSTVGATVDYTITITNTGDCALKNVVVTDTLLGPLPVFVTNLAIAGSDSHVVSRVVQVGDPNPLTNTATVHANPDVQGVDFTNDITAEASALVNLEVPKLAITKVANPTITKAGDVVTYTICIKNTGQIDLVNVAVNDTLLGPLAGFPTTLTVGQEVCLDFTRTTLAGDPNPLINTATVTGNPVGSQVVLTAQASAQVQVVHPSFTISKACSPDPVAVGGTLTWTITLNNTGDISLDIHVVDPTAGVDETDTVAAGGTHTITATHVVVAGDTSPIANTATATATLTGGVLPNVLGPQEASSSCAIQTGGPTRTQGYWFTHPDALKAGFKCITGSEGGTITLCQGCTVNANGAMAIFWKITGGNSNLATQILAAMFNECVLGTSAPDSIIQNGLDVLCNPNATAEEIGAATDALDAFNMSGDTLPFPPGVSFGNADPKASKAMANAGTIPGCITGTPK